MSIAREIELLRGRATDEASSESRVAKIAKDQGRSQVEETRPAYQRGLDLSRNLTPFVRPVITRIVRIS